MSAFFFAHPKEKDLALFAGGEAGPFARWRIERHLETCPRCERTVAEFFHLAEELSVLGDTPDLDWPAMAASIQARLAAEGSEAEIRTGLPGWTWQLGAAAACTLVAVAFLQVGPKTEMTPAPAAEQAIADNRAAENESGTAPTAAAPMERDLAKRSEEPAQETPPMRQLAQSEAEAAPGALLDEKKELQAPTTLAFADRVDEALATDSVAPAPPPAKDASMDAAAAGSAVLLAGERRSRESFESARAMGAGAPAPPAASGAMLGLAANLATAQPVSFTVAPLPADAQVGADGWISVRSINADGAMTITDVYEPQ